MDATTNFIASTILISHDLIFEPLRFIFESIQKKNLTILFVKRIDGNLRTYLWLISCKVAYGHLRIQQYFATEKVMASSFSLTNF